MLYRRRLKSDTIHSCQNCRNWPTKDYHEYTGTRPVGFDDCNQCRAKRLRQECTPALNGG